jgi:hypothetical protein
MTSTPTLALVEADDPPVLKRFSDALLLEVNGTPYEQVMLIDRNDRGIDVRIPARAAYALDTNRSHIFNTDPTGPSISWQPQSVSEKAETLQSGGSPLVSAGASTALE